MSRKSRSKQAKVPVDLAGRGADDKGMDCWPLRWEISVAGEPAERIISWLWVAKRKFWIISHLRMAKRKFSLTTSGRSDMLPLDSSGPNKLDWNLACKFQWGETMHKLLGLVCVLAALLAAGCSSEASSSQLSSVK